MAIQSAVFTFALPEDTDSDQLLIYSSTMKDGAYSVVLTVDYDYGIAQYEYDQLDDSLWYRIQFNNTHDVEHGPISDPVYGGNFAQGAPFLAISTLTDGANYATTQDVYDYSGLQPADISPSRVSAALRRARAWIDWRTAEMGLDRLANFSQDVARRKYNASLRVVKEAELNLALSSIYINLSDDLIMANMRGGEGSMAGTVSIGNTSVQGDALAERGESILYLATLAQRYQDTGEKLLASLDANSIRLVGYDNYVRSPRFLHPSIAHGRRI
jgi:hypothetical protein